MKQEGAEAIKAELESLELLQEEEEKDCEEMVEISSSLDDKPS